MSWLNPDDDSLEPYEEYADLEVRVRPNPKANRPRTKRRPEHQDALPGMVIGVDRGRYTVLISLKDEEREVTATRARELHKTSIVVGDSVFVVGDTSGATGSLARIVRIGERKTLLRRSADDTDRVERVIVAGADQMLIVIAAANPEPRVRLVDRYLVAAYDAGLEPLICVTKTDLSDPQDFLAHFKALDIPVFLSAPGDVPVEELRAALAGHKTVFVGHSGVGKSTLINVLVPEAERETGDVNVVTGRGRHTSSSSVVFALQDPDTQNRIGWVIDTPGVRSFGLGHVTQESILRGFTELHEIMQGCPRGCTHGTDAPDCALDDAIASGELSASGAARVHSLRRLIDQTLT